MVLPVAVPIAGLALYVQFGKLPVTAVLFLGIKATVLVIVIEALLRVSRRARVEPEAVAIAALAFLALFAFDMPYPLVVLAAAIWGTLRL